MGLGIHEGVAGCRVREIKGGAKQAFRIRGN